MITVNEAFRIFRTRRETTDTEDATASRRQRRLREQLDAALDIDEDFLTGSYVRHTKTKPLRDVDIMIVLTDTSYLKCHPHEILFLRCDLQAGRRRSDDASVLITWCRRCVAVGGGLGHGVGVRRRPCRGRCGLGRRGQGWAGWPWPWAQCRRFVASGTTRSRCRLRGNDRHGTRWNADYEVMDEPVGLNRT